MKFDLKRKKYEIQDGSVVYNHDNNGEIGVMYAGHSHFRPMGETTQESVEHDPGRVEPTGSLLKSDGDQN
jgi:hypothetical protein